MKTLNKLKMIFCGKKVNPEKFTPLIDILNETAYSGKGTIIMTDNNTFQLHDGTSQHIIIFQYEKTTELLTVTWRYDLQQRIEYWKKFDTRGATKEKQVEFANEFIDELYKWNLLPTEKVKAIMDETMKECDIEEDNE